MSTDYTIKPSGSLRNYTIITITHQEFGVQILYVPDVNFTTELKSIIRSAWINGCTILIQPAQ